MTRDQTFISLVLPRTIQYRKILCRLMGAVCLSYFGLQTSFASDRIILAMAQAFQKEDVAQLKKMLPAVKRHKLEPWAAYWTLKADLANAKQADLDAFFAKYRHTYVEDRMRADWLLLLGERKNWSEFEANYASYRMRDDSNIECYAQRRNAQLVEQRWMAQKQIQTGCQQVAQELIDAGAMSTLVKWRKNYTLAPATLVPPAMPVGFTDMTPQQKNWALGTAGRMLALQLDIRALQYFSQITNTADVSAEMLAWWVRVALRAQNWALVESIILAMEPHWQSSSPWREWLEKAQQQQGKSTLATAPVEPTLVAAQPLASDIARLKKNPGLQRALYAIKINLRQEGIREWTYEVSLANGSMSDTDRLAAAAIACQEQVWDRCINTSERTVSLVNWEQRYPLPFQAELVRHAIFEDLNPAYVYGLIRQESRFLTDAKSSVGASGLMQLMPATAQWTAKRLGIPNFSLKKLNQVDLNLRLGSAYLKYVLDENDGNWHYAAAAYNAGPHRVKAWRAAMANDPVAQVGDAALALAVWAENIPFSETREYVKKVIANAQAYQRRLESKK